MWRYAANNGVCFGSASARRRCEIRYAAIRMLTGSDHGPAKPFCVIQRPKYVAILSDSFDSNGMLNTCRVAMCIVPTPRDVRAAEACLDYFHSTH